MRTLLALLILFLPAQGMAQSSAIPVKVMTLAPGDMPVVREFYGRVTARSTVDLAFRTGGQIAKLPAVEGAFIPEGHMLAQLDLDSFERDLARAKASYDQAQRNYERRKTLGPDTTPQAQIDAARTDAELARVALADAEATLKNAVLLAPFDSLVASREAEQYATVSSGQTIVRIHDMSELRVAIEIPELLMRQAGSDPEVTAVAEIGGSSGPVSLEFRELTAEASDVGQTFRLTLAFVEDVPQRLLPGASVTVKVMLARSGNDARTLIPITSVRYATDGTPQVLVLEPEGVVSAHPVEIAPGPEGQFVLLDGPEPGSEIVAAGASRLSDGDAVRRYEGLLDQGVDR